MRIGLYISAVDFAYFPAEASVLVERTTVSFVHALAGTATIVLRTDKKNKKKKTITAPAFRTGG